MRLKAVLFVVLMVSVAMTPAVAVGSQSEKPAGKSSDPQSVDNLDPKVLAIMRHQERLQPAVQALYGEHVKDEKSGFAGLRFEDGGLTLYYKGDLTAGFRQALAEANQAGSVQLKSAMFSLAELKADGEKIYARIKQRGLSDIQSIGYSPDGSGLKIELLPAVAAQAQVEYATREGLPAPVAGDVILRESNLQAPAEVTTAKEVFRLQSRLADSPPWNGGGRWETWRNGSRRYQCTTGFGVVASGRTWVLTAAHCASLGDTAYQGVSGGTLNVMGPINSDQRDFDMLLIDAPGWYLVFDGGPSTNNTKRVKSWGYWSPGELVCHSGARTGVRCNLEQLYGHDVIVSCSSPDSDGACGYRIRELVRTRQIDGLQAAQAGDSGGPVYTLDGDGFRAKGTITSGSGSEMSFQDWHDAIRLFGAYPRTS